ncbi:hypothetical protein [Calycomorphotria hydatis]|uniref:Peptidase C51 domain-containing protein n=1 Tax=Calycomorphotria hydatis TaxID=2528027 RepID=A0A517T5D5_9PLAN|nr:hypothetical protein [Calycomorphotria hydatis]QDT63589.1 hypothetical protein V22_08130 [Calycomorphotria hydatis]
MNKTRITKTLLLLLCFCVQTVCIADSGISSERSESATSSKQELGAQFADRIKTLMETAKETAYQHTTEIDESRGIVKCDCSGLIGHTLRTHFPEAYVALRGEEASWRKRPVAVTYFETFLASGNGESNHWRQVHTMTDLVPGDIIAWRKKYLKAGSTTGHVCMVASAPVVLDDETVSVRIMESARRVTGDTRPEGVTGLNMRNKKFIVNKKGEPIGYYVGERKVFAGVSAGRIISSSTSDTLTSDAEFIGKNLNTATMLAKQKNLKWRVIREDGDPKQATWKIANERLNFVVENGIVTKVLRG